MLPRTAAQMRAYRQQDFSTYTGYSFPTTLSSLEGRPTALLIVPVVYPFWDGEASSYKLSCYYVVPLDMGFSIPALNVFGDSTVDAGNTTIRRTLLRQISFHTESILIAFHNRKTVADYI
ncbi:hypothetical protein U1Q18_041654 [Sarracenia purpurea var. burkii]